MPITPGPEVTAHRATTESLWSIMTAQRTRIRDTFEAVADGSTADLASFGEPEGWRGRLTAWSSADQECPELDWMVQCDSGDPDAGITTMALSAWLGPRTRVPHLCLAWGTLPQLWFSIDLLSRADLAADDDYVQRYIAPTNDRFVELSGDEDLTPLVSRALSVRRMASPTALRFLCSGTGGGTRSGPDRTEERVDQIGRLAEERVTEWLGWIDSADEVPVAERDALAARDLRVRRTLAETDPANRLGDRYLGDEVASRVIGALWGAGRSVELPGT